MAEHTAVSVNKVTIRLTDERWFHISEGHPEMAGLFFEILETISAPDFIAEGNSGELIAVKALKNEKNIVAVYKETDKKDGFVITSFLTNKIASIKKRTVLWEKQR